MKPDFGLLNPAALTAGTSLRAKFAEFVIFFADYFHAQAPTFVLLNFELSFSRENIV